MKTAANIVLMLGVCLLVVLTRCRPNFVDHASLDTSGGLSRWLAYSIEFHPAEGVKEAEFTATLTNVCPYTLSIDLNDKRFHASFAVKPKTGKGYKVFDREYMGLILSATWFEPVTVLAPLHSVTWAVPVSSLVTEQNALVTEESLSESTVSSEMVMAIVPKPGMAKGYVSDNATQTSNSIRIP